MAIATKLKIDKEDFEKEIISLQTAMDGMTAAEMDFIDGAVAGTGAASKAVVLDSGEDYIWPSGGKLTYGGTAINATGAEINAACDVSARYISLVAGDTTYTVLAANSGKTHVIPDLSASCVFTMPAVAAGLEYRFVYSGAAIEAHNWTFDLSTTSNFFKGGLMHVDEDDTQANVSSNGSSNDFMTIVKPDTGTMVSLLCDGTNWIAWGQVYGADAPTFADT